MGVESCEGGFVRSVEKSSFAFLGGPADGKVLEVDARYSSQHSCWQPVGDYFRVSGPLVDDSVQIHEYRARYFAQPNGSRIFAFVHSSVSDDAALEWLRGLF